MPGRADTERVRDYAQYCPIALASEVLAERWTPLIVRELVLGGRRFNEIDRGLPVLDFAGRAATHEQVARAFGVQVAPTVLFIGRGGREAAERITGVPLLDFYGAYLQERVDKANRSLA